MNEFLEQFLAESRELVEQATDDLLALEDQGADRERLDSAFRAFHTLKGAAGIMDFDAMGRALHAAEDVLAAARSGEAPLTPGLVGDCLACLDQVVQWLDAMEASGEPPAGAAAEADRIVQRFERGPPAAAPATNDDWARALLARHPEAGRTARAAVRYRPAADSFFQDVDPLALVATLPGLLALEIRPTAPWPELASLDPFDCRLAFEALLGAPAPAAVDRLRTAGAIVETAELAAPAAAGGGDLSAALLEAQVLMLRASTADGLAGRIGAAGRVAVSVLRHSGRNDEADGLDNLLRQGPAGDPEPLALALEQILAGSFEPAAPAEAPAERIAAEASARTLRVDVERVDALVSLTGELMVARNAFGHALALAQSGGDVAELAALLKSQHAHLGRLVEDLQRTVLGLRVLPLRHVFQRFPRQVREMVVALGKPARLVTEGDATEADKAVVESLFEPLLHVVRNAMDHGVETAAERAAAGKPPSATLTLRGRRDGDRVLVEVEDDGRGVDVARVREIAGRRGVASSEDLAAMSDEQAIGLIFAPGFSTSAEVTHLSGRGVGMDAVRTAVERLGGRVNVESQPGQGTLVRLTLPFTVMMSRVMTVECAGQAFGIPMEAIVETVRVPRDGIAAVGAARAFVLRNRTIPLIPLAEILGRPGAAQSGGDAQVVVVSAGGSVGGLEVDRLGDRLDVMLKPMEGLLAGAPGLAGTTLLGDGRVLLVLDVQELLQ